MLPRGIVGRDGARLRQDRRQADARDGARHCRPAARVNGNLQRVRGPRAGVRAARQHRRRRVAPQRRRVDPRRSGRRRDGARLHEVGRCAKVARTFRRIGRARVQDRDDTAARPGRHRRRRGHAGRGRPAGGPRQTARSPAVADVTARRRLRRRRRARAHARRRRQPGHRRGTRGADAEGHPAPRRARRTPAGAGQRRPSVHAAHELPVAPSAERRRRHRQRRPRRRPRGARLLPGDARHHAGEPLRHGVAARRRKRARSW